MVSENQKRFSAIFCQSVGIQHRPLVQPFLYNLLAIRLVFNSIKLAAYHGYYSYLHTASLLF